MLIYEIQNSRKHSNAYYYYEFECRFYGIFSFFIFEIICRTLLKPVDIDRFRRKSVA